MYDVENERPESLLYVLIKNEQKKPQKDVNHLTKLFYYKYGQIPEMKRVGQKFFQKGGQKKGVQTWTIISC